MSKVSQRFCFETDRKFSILKMALLAEHEVIVSLQNCPYDIITRCMSQVFMGTWVEQAKSC